MSTSFAPTKARLAAFGELEIEYDDRVLTPRPWTVLQSEWAAEVAPSAPAGPLLEVCSGAGHIGLLAAARTGRRLVQVDASPVACAFARANAARAGLRDRVEVRCATIGYVQRTGERFPVMIADPPYIPTAEIARFPEDPVVAIDGGDDGLELARQCLDLFAASLLPGGFGLVQLGRAEHVQQLATRAPDHLALLGTRSAGPTRHVALFGRADGCAS